MVKKGLKQFEEEIPSQIYETQSILVDENPLEREIEDDVDFQKDELILIDIYINDVILNLDPSIEFKQIKGRKGRQTFKDNDKENGIPNSKP